MKYKPILQQIKNNWKKAAKCLSFCFAVFLVFAIVFYSPKSQSTITDSCTLVSNPNPGVNCLPNCNNLDNATTANPGVNCLYLDLPICTSNSQATSTIADPKPRINCADVIDLPLCSDVNSNPKELKNCVKKCSDIADGTGIRGIDYAVHNRDCVRFCSDSSENLTDPSFLALPQSKQCVAARCHQILEGDTGTYNCNLLSCKLLTVEELNDNKFQDQNKKYCDGDSDKCYSFSQDKLQYLIPNKMCQIHDCSPQPQPASSSCNDDANNIIAKGNSFTQDYLRYIVKQETPASLNSSDGNTAVKEQLSELCNTPTKSCLPLVKRQYRCDVLTDEDPPSKLNANCDANTTCDSDGFCDKTIDCNINTSEPECLQSSTNPEDIILDQDDESWFYNPKPMDKSINSSKEIIKMSNDLCYTKGQMKEHGWGKDILILGYFHSQFKPDRSRSPGMCDVAKGGKRGTGYLYLCGNEGVLNKKVSAWTAYNSSISTTTFTNTDSTTKVKVCLRFKNSFRPMDTVSNSETCGKRECAISCAFGLCKSQLCGEDVCRTLTVKETRATDCIMNEDSFNNTNDRSCSSIIDDNLRVRAVQYSNKVCTFLDSKGQLAYNRMFMNGKETLSDGTCLGQTNSGGNCNGKNSNDIEGQATFWRAVMLIQHVMNNRNSDPRGYLKKNGQLVKEQECIKIPLRVRTPRLYNLVTKNNAFKLFTPPVYISNSYVERDSNTISLPESTSDKFGPTDFNYPKIEVTYGEDTKQILSLSINKTGYETDEANQDSNASAHITTNFNGYDYETDILIRKDFNSETSTPTLCLYQKIVDTLDNEQIVKIECINRTFPEIDSTSPNRKVIITAPTTNTYDNAKISLKYRGLTANDLSDEIILGNQIQSKPECSSTVENYKICVQREECNMLNNEFVINEINIQNAAYGSDISQMLALRDYFTNSLTPICNKKSGILTDSSSTTNSTYQAANAYGWFNEICISSGFNTKLRDVLAYKVFDNKGIEIPSIKGKCIIDAARSLNGGAACTDGGKAPNCICLDATNITPNANQVIRKETPREAGLCVDITTPAMCPAISYNSDAARTAGTSTGNSDFLTPAYGGMNNVLGQCLGNWRNSQINGVDVPPKMNCVRNPDNTVAWSSTITHTVTNPCQRYSCPVITTEPRINSGVISYTNSYTTENETTDVNKGQSNGYALWNSKTSNDTMQTASAISCITGFKANGNLPTRGCSSKGIWQNIENACVRKTCPALNFVSNAAFDSDQWNAAWSSSSNNPLRSGLSDNEQYNIWYNWNRYGGASFPQTNASRIVISSTTDGVATESIATGVCNQKLGYFPLGNGPTMKCDQNGNWVFLENRCVTSCTAITNGDSYDGNASWNAATVSNSEESSTVSAVSCNSGFYPYPYSAPKDVDGNFINYTVDPNDSSKKLYVENTPLARPQRKCQNSDIRVGNNIIKAAVWKNAYPSCINKCPGAATDSRIGVGITKHKLSDGNYIYLEWGDLSPGESQILYSSIPQTASDYSPNHALGIYAVKRTCGTNYKWESYSVNGVTEYVKPQCSSRSGTINNSNNAISGTSDTVDENTILTASCGSGYAISTTTNSPQYKCRANSNNLRHIDEFYYEKTGGEDCKKTCALPSKDTLFGNGSKYVDGASGTKFEGDKITLACQAGYGKALDSDLSNSDSNCGRVATDRTNISPTTTCLSTGLWSSSVSNDCSACRSCNFQAGNVTISGDTSIKDGSPLNCKADTEKNRDRVCDFDASWMQNPPTSSGNCKIVSCTPSDRNPASGTSISCQGSDTEDATDCESKTMNAFITMSCIDGKATVTSLNK